MGNISEYMKSIDFAELSALIGHFGAGNHYDNLSRDFLANTLQKRLAANHCQRVDEYLIILKNEPGEVLQLNDSLSIGFSEFFRNPFSFSALEHIILPGILKRLINSGRREIRIWSAACAAGQEVYSLAILLNELQHQSSQSYTWRIFASDASQPLIGEASKGIYKESALQKVTMHRFHTWFDRVGDNYTVKPALRKNIEFLVFDLFDKNYCYPPESIFGDFDLVLCANMLFYYTPEAQRLILRKLEKSQAKGGYIMTGESERGIFRLHHFKEVIPHTAIFRKWKK